MILRDGYHSYVINNPVLYNDPDGHCVPVCTVPLVIGVATILAFAYLLDDYGDNGELDILPDAAIVSAAVNDSVGLFGYEDDQDSPVIAGVDGVFTSDQSSDFYTSTDRANINECSPNIPCVNKKFPYTHGETPNIGAGGAVGLIWSNDVKENIDNYEGRAYNITVSVGIFSVTGFSSADEYSGETNYKTVGLTVGVGKSLLPSYGGYYTRSTKKSDMDGCYTGRGGIKSIACGGPDNQ